MSKFKAVTATIAAATGITAIGVMFVAPAFADGIAYDLNGDGLRETTVSDDEGHDGLYETIQTDLNGDKHWDLVMYDWDGNGRAEFATYDEGDDGDFEWILEDQNADGVYEKVFNRNVDQRTPMEKAMQNPDFARAMGRIADMNADNSDSGSSTTTTASATMTTWTAGPTPGIAIRRTRTTDFVR